MVKVFCGGARCEVVQGVRCSVGVGCKVVEVLCLLVVVGVGLGGVVVFGLGWLGWSLGTCGVGSLVGGVSSLWVLGWVLLVLVLVLVGVFNSFGRLWKCWEWLEIFQVFPCAL